MKTTFECTSNDNLIVIEDGRATGDGIEVWFGNESRKGGMVVIGLEDLQAAFDKAGISPLQRPPGDHKRHGRKKPYTNEGIVRIPCFRCGQPSAFQWSICADGNIQRPLCAACDIDLNNHVLAWSGDPDAASKLDGYVQTVLSYNLTPQQKPSNHR